MRRALVLAGGLGHDRRHVSAEVAECVEQLDDGPDAEEIRARGQQKRPHGERADVNHVAAAAEHQQGQHEDLPTAEAGKRAGGIGV